MALRVSGVLATLACMVMAASDLLLLTTLDFRRPYPLWEVLNGISDHQALWGYYLGVLGVPFYCLGAWHFALAVRPAGRWASWLVFLAMVYSACLFAVWHASFAFYRSLLRAGANQQAEFAFSHYAQPVLWIGLLVVGTACVVVMGLILMNKTLYPRWAVLVSPLVFGVLVWSGAPHALGPFGAVLRAAGWNVAGTLSLAVSTMILWNHAREAA